MIIQPPFPLFPTVFLRLSSPSLAKSSMSELSAFEDVQNPEILPLLHSSFLKICSTMRLRWSSWRWATSSTVKPAKTSSQENVPPSILQTAKLASKALQKKKSEKIEYNLKWYQMKTRFPAIANQRWSYILGRIRVHCTFRVFFSRAHQGALHDNGLSK